MANTSKQENILLEQAYLSIYDEKVKEIMKKSEDTEEEAVEEAKDEEPEDDKMAAAVAIQQTADEVEDQGGEVNQQLKKAKQESEKYVNTKISQFKAK